MQGYHTNCIMERVKAKQTKTMSKNSPQHHHTAPEQDEELKSKSEIKREMIQLQDFAEKLIKLSKHQRSKLPLTETLADALLLADKIMNKHEALRRHIRYMAKVLSEMDLTPIHQALDVMANKHQQESIKHTKLETIRDNLLTQNNDAIEQLLQLHNSMERQQLRQLVRQAKKELNAEKPAKHYQTLFHYLKKHIVL